MNAILSRAIQSLKQSVARRLALRASEPFWQARYYDFNVWTEKKRTEKPRYMHRNPVKRDWWRIRRTGNGADLPTTWKELPAWWRLNRTGLQADGKEWESDCHCGHCEFNNSRPSRARDGAPQRVEWGTRQPSDQQDT